MIALVTEWTISNGGGHYKRMLALHRADRKTKASRLFVFTDLPEAALGAAFGDPFPSGVVPGRTSADLSAFLGSLPPDAPVCVDLRDPGPEHVGLLSSTGRKIFYYDRFLPPAPGRGTLVDLVGLGRGPDAGQGFRRIYEPGCVLVDDRFRRLPPARSRRILVTFGSTDPFGLTRRILPVLRELAEESFLLILPLTWEGDDPESGNVRTVRFGSDILPWIRSSDVILSAYGTTVWESIASGRRVFIVDPTRYHRKVSALLRSRGVPGIFSSDLTVAALRLGLEQSRAISEDLVKQLAAGVKEGARRLGGVLRSDPFAAALGRCAVCGSKRLPPLSISSDSGLFRCRRCGSHSRRSSVQSGTSYNAAYFRSAYASQYGRTYIQDRPAMDRFNAERVAVLKRLLRKPQRPEVLDLGCALGFFLDTARKAGFGTEGVELIPQAADYARKKLRLKVSRSDLLGFKTDTSYDCVTLWYVLEHLPAPEAVFRKASGMLKKGGILALSVPHSSGFTFRFNRPLWLFQRPADHYFDFSLRGLDLLARKFGLRRVRVVWRGIHLDRLKSAFPVLRNLPETPFFRSLFREKCRFLGLGDTFEAYYRRMR